MCLWLKTNITKRGAKHITSVAKLCDKGISRDPTNVFYVNAAQGKQRTDVLKSIVITQIIAMAYKWFGYVIDAIAAFTLEHTIFGDWRKVIGSSLSTL